MEIHLKEIVAYEGSSYTIEWFYDEQGKSDALEFFNGLDDANKRKVMMLFKRNYEQRVIAGVYYVKG